MSREKLYILAEKTWKAVSKKCTFYIVKFYMALDNFWHVEIANMYVQQSEHTSGTFHKIELSAFQFGAFLSIQVWNRLKKRPSAWC